MTTRMVELSHGAMRYRDSGGSGSTLLFVHGVFTDSRLWKSVIDLLGGDYRCLAPDLPLGAHEYPCRPGFEPTPAKIAKLLGELLAELDVQDATLVATDTGGAISQLFLMERSDRVGRAVLTPCDSFDNFFPPSLRPFQHAARVPGALKAGVSVMRNPWLRGLAYRSVSRRAIDPELTRAWVEPARINPQVRKDIRRLLRTIDKRDTLHAADQLRHLDIPVLLLWPRQLPFFPYEHAERWLQILPNATLVEAPPSRAFVCHDQPEFAAAQISSFIGTGSSNSVATAGSTP